MSILEKLLAKVFTSYDEEAKEHIIEGVYSVLIVDSFTGNEIDVRAIRDGFFWDRNGVPWEIPSDEEEIVVLVEEQSWK